METCRQGHPLTPDNLYRNGTAKPRCRICCMAKNAVQYSKHAEKIKAKRKARYLEDPEPVRLQVRDYTHRMRATVSGDQRETRAWMSSILFDPCAYCGKPSQSDDHIVPLAAGGEHAWGNLTRACRSCNSRKQNKPLLLWMMERLVA